MLGACGLGLSELIHGQALARAAAANGSPSADSTFGRARRCVLLFLTGGPSQHDTWDMKPEAPAEVRGELRPIDTAVPGIKVSELFPLFARQTDKVCLVRSVTHDDTVHTSAGYTMLTGRRHAKANAKTAADIRPEATDHPHVGAMLARLRPSAGPPTFVALPEIIRDDVVNEYPGLSGGFLGDRYAPLLIEGTAESGKFRRPPLALPEGVSAQRIAARRRLLSELGATIPGRIENPSYGAVDDYQQRAFDLISSPQARQAFELEREPAAAHDRYGRHLFGQGCLLARRLLEVGVSLVTVYWHYDGPKATPVWDTHGNHYPQLRERLAPHADRAMAAMLADLGNRGLLDDTLFITMGEFGRTPRINREAGRDHWPHVQTIVMAGAGIRAGCVYGASDRQGAYPADQPISPADLIATILHALGVPSDADLHDPLGRPHKACEGTAVLDLFA